MNIVIEKYFEEETDNINFIELKNDNVEIGNLNLKKGLPLPIRSDEFIREIKHGSFEETINIDYIINGIILLLGADSEFKYKKTYMEILKIYNKNIEEYILYKGIKSLEDRNNREAGCKFRTILLLNPNNCKALFNYAITLELISSELLKKGEEEKAEIFLTYSTDNFEKILNIDEEFELAYYKLGYHYKNNNQFLKASITWNKFLEKGSDDLLLQEIREEIEIIEDDSNIETGMTYMSYGEFEKALNYFNKLLPKHERQWNIHALISQAYNGLKKLEKSIEHLNIAIELNPKNADLYNDLGILYFNGGNFNKAIEIMGKGLEIDSKNYRLYFNRGLCYIELEEYNRGFQDLDKAIELNPNDNTLKDYKNRIEEQLK